MHLLLLGAKKKDSSPGANGSESSLNENGNKVTSPEDQNPEILADVTVGASAEADLKEESDENEERTNFVSQEKDDSHRDQTERAGVQPVVYQDVTVFGSDAKSLVTPHGSVAEGHGIDIAANSHKVHSLSLANGGMVTALASSEPSKPRLGEFTVGSYPGEASEEGDPPGTLQSHQEEVFDRRYSSDSDAPIKVQAASFVPNSEGNTLSDTTPKEFEVNDIVEDRDSTEPLMGDTDEQLSASNSPVDRGHSNQDQTSPSEEDFDFYRKYRTPTMLPVSPDSQNPEEVTSSGESSAEDIPIPENIQQKLAGSWMQCSVPGFITQLLVSDKNVWCVDNHDKIYHTLVNRVNYKWNKLKDSAMQVAVSPSESIVWRVHRRTQVAYASSPITQRSQVGSRWDPACKDVAFVCLDDTMAWIIKTNGHIVVHKNISRDRPYSKSIQVDSNMRIEQIAAHRGVVWGLNEVKTVVFRTDISTIKPQGRLWREITDR